jgi:uncharacterized protein YpiB (UPF0302 family)
MHNYFSRSRYNYSGQIFHVLAMDGEEAINIAIHFKHEIEQYLRSKRVHPSRKLLIRKSDSHKLTDKSFHSPVENTVRHTMRLIDRNGQFNVWNVIPQYHINSTTP